jgi:hypothetical protein
MLASAWVGIMEKKPTSDGADPVTSAIEKCPKCGNLFDTKKWDYALSDRCPYCVPGDQKDNRQL